MMQKVNTMQCNDFDMCEVMLGIDVTLKLNKSYAGHCYIIQCNTDHKTFDVNIDRKIRKIFIC